MELGNAVFGHSRGNFPVPRSWDTVFTKLFDACDPSRDTSWREYGTEFENDTFYLFPYYWGNCTCGFDSLEFKGEHIGCYQNEFDEERLRLGWTKAKYWLEAPKDWSYEKWSKTEHELLKKLCKKHNLSFPDACMVHCTCDYDDRYEQWLIENGYPEEHRSDCLLEKPNFFYKPTGFALRWYKYPLRDSYMSHDIKRKDLVEIVAKCVKSVGL